MPTSASATTRRKTADSAVESLFAKKAPDAFRSLFCVQSLPGAFWIGGFLVLPLAKLPLLLRFSKIRTNGFLNCWLISEKNYSFRHLKSRKNFADPREAKKHKQTVYTLKHIQDKLMFFKWFLDFFTCKKDEER
jgi:hypothetical protein